MFILISSFCVAIDAACCNVVNGIEDNKTKYSIITSVTFSLFQGLMLLLGYYFTFIFKDIVQISTILSFMLLMYLSINMFISIYKKEEVKSLNIKNILIQGLATSIDASALGITFRVLQLNIIYGLICVMLITLILSFIAFILGNKVGLKINKYAKILGSLILFLLAIKILLF